MKHIFTLIIIPKSKNAFFKNELCIFNKKDETATTSASSFCLCPLIKHYVRIR